MKLEPRKPKEEGEALWNMDFDGVVSKKGAWEGVFIVNSQTNIAKGHSYKLNFQCTDNITEYEALIVGLQLLNRLGEKIIFCAQGFRTHN